MKLSKNGETANMTEIGPGRKRRILNTDKLMMVVIDFEDGPAAKLLRDGLRLGRIRQRHSSGLQAEERFFEFAQD